MSLTGKIMDFFTDKAMTIPAFPRTKVKAVSDDDGVGLEVLLDNKADSTHTHAINDIDGTLPITKGGTGATDAVSALSNLGISYGATLPDAGTAGRIFFKTE